MLHREGQERAGSSTSIRRRNVVDCRGAVPRSAYSPKFPRRNRLPIVPPSDCFSVIGALHNFGGSQKVMTSLVEYIDAI